VDAPAEPDREVEPVHAWELDLLKKVASAFRTPNRDDLDAELAKKLLELKRRRPTQVRDWRAYLAKFFYNKAHNFVRDERARARREQAPREPQNPSLDWKNDDLLVLDSVWRELSAEEQRLWSMLAECDGNQSRAAQKLGLHRNTIRARLGRIRALLSRRGYRST
jgi:DNA-directed RNA polymerase specialized sigma24 family protein